MKKIIIAIDGLSACGKSTTAIGAAKKLEYTFVDSGAMYRAVTLYFLENNIDPENKLAVSKALKNINVQLKFNPLLGRSEVFLNSRNVEKQIRTMSVSKMVSEVSSIPEVRKKMVALQREMGITGGIVMDGRDIGTNVFPNAELKFFVTADTDVRVERRLAELKEKGIGANPDEVKENLLKRDNLDQSREENPLIRAEDAILMDTSHMTIEEQIDFVVNEALNKINPDAKS